MHIHKAIEILEQVVDTDECTNWPDYIAAVRLGNEALIRIEEGRLADPTTAEAYLPGETIVYDPVRKP